MRTRYYTKYNLFKAIVKCIKNIRHLFVIVALCSVTLHANSQKLTDTTKHPITALYKLQKPKIIECVLSTTFITTILIIVFKTAYGKSVNP